MSFATPSMAFTGPGQARTWLAIFGSAYVVALVLCIVTVLTPAPYGDLTRIGRVPESDFGWRTGQAAVPRAALADASLAEADVLVIGDSFSVGRLWQSVLVGQGLKVATTHWDQIGNALCGDLDEWLRSQGFRGRTVIVQTVQRWVVRRMDRSAACARTQGVYRPMGDSAAPPDEPPGWALNDRAKLSTGITTWTHGLRVRRDLREVVFRDPDNDIPLVSVRPLADGCVQFSHRLCDRGLFLAEDVMMDVPGDRQSAIARRISSAHPALRIVWMIVPDKTTVYAEPGRGAGFARQIEAAGLGPDLFAHAQAARRSIRDFYWPNDTHLSTRGMLDVGEEIRRWIERSAS